MRTPLWLLVLPLTLIATLNAPAHAKPKSVSPSKPRIAATPSLGTEPSAPGSNWFVALEPLWMQTKSQTGGRVRLSFDDSSTPEVDEALLGADGVDHEAYSPRITFGWRLNLPSGISGGLQGRFADLKDATSGPARLVPGTVELPNFSTDSETNSLALYTGDIEAALAYSAFGLTLEGTYGTRAARFKSEGEIEAFGVFTTGNFVQLQFSNGSAFEGDGHVEGFSLAYRIPRVPVSVFVGRRTSTMTGESDSFGRSVGSVASSPNPPLIGAATVTRNNNTETELELNETRYGIQADFGAPGARYRSFARISFERTSWDLDGPPTGGAGFGGTIGTLTTSGFASAGLGGATLEGWALSIGMAF